MLVYQTIFLNINQAYTPRWNFSLSNCELRRPPQGLRSCLVLKEVKLLKLSNFSFTLSIVNKALCLLSGSFKNVKKKLKPLVHVKAWLSAKIYYEAFCVTLSTKQEVNKIVTCFKYFIGSYFFVLWSRASLFFAQLPLLTKFLLSVCNWGHH